MPRWLKVLADVFGILFSSLHSLLGMLSFALFWLGLFFGPVSPDATLVLVLLLVVFTVSSGWEIWQRLR